MTGKKDGSSETEGENEQTDPLDRRIQVEDELRQEHAVAQATRKPSIWAKTDESPYTIILTGGALFGRILRASRCCCKCQEESGSPSLLGIAEFIAPTGSFFHAQTRVLIPHYRRAFPKCEDEP